MNQRRDLSWLIALVAIAAGFLIGLWAGSQWLPRLSGAEVSDLTSDQQDEYVTLVALGFAQTGDQELSRKQLEALQAPNLGHLVAGVIERRAAAAAGPQELAALAQMATAFGISNSVIASYMPTSTPPPTPTPLPPTPTPLPPTSTPEVPAVAPTATPETATATPTIPAQPIAIAIGEVNLRSGPGLTYAVIGDLAPGESALLIGRNPAGDWWQVQREDGSTGWVLGQLVTIEGNTESIPVAEAPPPPTPTRVAVAPTATSPRPTPVPPKPNVDYRVVSRRLWTPQETGANNDNGSIGCGGARHEIWAYVRDVNGNPLNGVTVGSIYPSGNPPKVSGSKGPGIAQFDIYPPGDGLRVIRDVDGREVVSESAEMPGSPGPIPDDVLIGAGYCRAGDITDGQSCAHLRAENGCAGHFSWDVIFQRTY